MGSAILLGLAVFLTLRGLAAEETPVLVAARDVPAGHVLTAADLRTISAPARVLPAEAVSDTSSALGRRLVLPLNEGEMLTTARTDAARALGPLRASERAVHVRAADPGSLSLVRAGDRVDLLAVPDGRTVASDVRVLAIDARETADPLGSTTPTSGLTIAAPTSSVPAIVAAAEGVHPALRLAPGEPAH